MNRKHLLSDSDFLDAFEKAELTAIDWTHETHLRMAFLYLSRFPFEEALQRIRSGILYLNSVIGVQKRGYHETITRAFAELVVTRVKPGLQWDEFRDRNGDLFSSEILLTYYHRETLNSIQAKESYVEPDLRAFATPPSYGLST